MTTFKPGTVVLIRFPFTDLSSAKKRPAVVVSPESYGNRYGDAVIVPLTSVDQDDDQLCLSHWKESNLVKQTWVKPLLATVSTSLIERELGRLHQEDLPCIYNALEQMLFPYPGNGNQ